MAFAICTVNVPTPPPAPITSTTARAAPVPCREGPHRGGSRIGTAAACSNVSRWGFGRAFCRGDRELGERATLGGAHHVVTRLESRSPPSRRLRLSPRRPSRGPRSSADGTRPQHGAGHVGLPAHDVPHVRSGPRRPNADERVVVPDRRRIDVAELKHVRLAVPVLRDRLDSSSSSVPFCFLVYAVHLRSQPRVYVVHLSTPARPGLERGVGGWPRRSSRARRNASP